SKNSSTSRVLRRRCRAARCTTCGRAGRTRGAWLAIVSIDGSSRGPEATAAVSAELLEWVVSHVGHHLLAVRRNRPCGEGVRCGILSREVVEVELARQPVPPALRALETRLDRRREVVLLDLERPNALGVRDAAIADAVGIARDGVHHGSGARERLRARIVVVVLEDVLLEEHVRAGIVLAAVEVDRRVAASDVLPVGHLPREDLPELRKGELLHRVRLRDVDRKRVEGDRLLLHLAALLR